MNPSVTSSVNSSAESSAEINDVSDTSFWVAYYRAQETDRPNSLFKDPLAKLLVGERGRQLSESMAEISRYTEWSVLSRTVIIDRYIEKLIAKEHITTVVNLGAGLDTRPYRMNLPKSLHWIEVDYSKIIQYKENLLQEHQPQCHLERVGVDLADSEERRRFLSRVAQDGERILVLTEGVIPYLSPAQVTDLSQDLCSHESFLFWITEYFHPQVYKYLKSTVHQLKMKKAPVQFYPEDWYGFFKSRGWKEKETRFTGEIAEEFNRRPPLPRFIQLIFPFLPKKIKEQSKKMNGYVIFERIKV